MNSVYSFDVDIYNNVEKRSDHVQSLQTDRENPCEWLEKITNSTLRPVIPYW